MNVNKIILKLGLTLLVTACSQDPSSIEDNTKQSNSTSEKNISTKSIQESNKKPDDSIKVFHQKSSSQLVPGKAHVTIEGEGLRIFDNETGHATPIVFNSLQNSTISTLNTLFGEPNEQGKNEECGVDFINWNGLITYFLNNKFVGWAVNDSKATHFATASGVGIGTTRVELKESYDAEIKKSTIGLEFSAVGLNGLLSSAKPHATITNLWAGQACILR
ncbi:MAG: hypothetical protein V4629_12065 [Pseudomonadota bacterium]